MPFPMRRAAVALGVASFASTALPFAGAHGDDEACLFQRAVHVNVGREAALEPLQDALHVDRRGVAKEVLHSPAAAAAAAASNATLQAPARGRSRSAEVSQDSEGADVALLREPPPPPEPEPRRSPHLVVAVLLAPILLWVARSPKAGTPIVIMGWMMSSACMNVSNDMAAEQFPATNLLVIIQMLVADVILLVSEYHELRACRGRDLAKWLVVPLFFAAMLTTSMAAFKETTVTSVLVLRNALPLVAFSVEKFFFNTPPIVTGPMVLSMVTVLAGTFIYGAWNISVTGQGVFLIVLNCGLTVIDRVLQRQFLSDPEFTLTIPLCLLLNNILGIIPLIGIAFATSEVSTWKAAVLDTTLMSAFWVAMSSLLGFCIGFLGLRCQKVVSATTFLMLQNLTKILVIALGVFGLGDPLGGPSVIGCTVSLVGSLWYGFTRLPQEVRASAGGAEAAPESVKQTVANRANGIQGAVDKKEAVRAAQG